MWDWVKPQVYADKILCMHIACVTVTGLTLIVREMDVYLCKQVGSRPAAE